MAKGRHPLYLTIEMFEKFKNNDFYHLKHEVTNIRWLVLTILAVIIGTLVVRFIWG